MDNDFNINFEWEEAPSVQGDELRATWARLQININGQTPTQVYHSPSKTVRPAVYLPLYPLAEWIVDNWWFLLAEYESPQRPNYVRRHSLVYAREGYALPRLRFVPLGINVQLEWEREELPDCRLEFLTSGRKELEASKFAEVLLGLCEAVVTRLKECRVNNTYLETEWQALLALDSEEQAFCRSAARLGQDPFSMSAEERDQIVHLDETVPKELQDDFFSAARWTELRNQATALSAAVEEIRRVPSNLSRLQELRAEISVKVEPSTPWQEGYQVAQILRKKIGLNGERIKTFDDLALIFNVPRESWRTAILGYKDNCRFFDALVGPGSDNSPAFLVEKLRDDSRKFAFCRAAFEYLGAPENSFALVSDVRSDRQKRSRAFAAEFLAPSELLRKEIHGRYVSSDEIEELVADFAVSTYVIEHQIENHQIAQIVK